MSSTNTQLTVEQRLEAYKWAWDKIDSGQTSMCLALMVFFNNINGVGYIGVMDTICFFPEFAQYEPLELAHRYSSWFEETEMGNEWRKIVLDECIAECEQQLLTSKTIQQ